VKAASHLDARYYRSLSAFSRASRMKSLVQHASVLRRALDGI